MQLNVILEASTLDELKLLIDHHFGQPMRVLAISLSMFEQYDVRPVAHAYIPKIWFYRVVARNGKYYLGTL